MPEVKDKTTGKVVGKFDYNTKGEEAAEKLANTDINLEVDYAPGGEYDAPNMREQIYAGGGKTGYNKIGMYKKGGKVK